MRIKLYVALSTAFCLGFLVGGAVMLYLTSAL